MEVGLSSSFLMECDAGAVPAIVALDAGRCIAAASVDLQEHHQA
jgi:hypothetical protein